MPLVYYFKMNGKATYDSLDVLVLAVHLLHPEDVVAEVQALEAALLVQEDDHHAAGPVQALPEQLPEENYDIKTNKRREKLISYSILNSFSPTGMQ